MKNLKKSIKSIGLLLIILLIGLSVTGCGTQDTSNQDQQGEDNKFTGPIKLMAANPGGEWYPIAVAIGDAWSKAGLGEATILPGGGVSNIVGVNSKQADIGMTFACTADDGLEGRESFKEKLDGYSVLVALNSSYIQPVVFANSGINSVADLKGKRINVYTKGYTSEANARILLKAYDLTYDDMKTVMYLSDDDAIDQLKDGHLDATISTGGIPDAGFIDASSMKPVRVLPIDKDKTKVLAETNKGLDEAVIPKGTYGIPEDVTTVGTKLVLIVRNDMPEDVVYNLVKVFDENLTTFYNVNSNLKEVTTDTMSQAGSLPFHPGAIKYFKEKGVM